MSAFYQQSPGPKWRARSPGNVADEVQLLVTRFGVQHLNFVDDNFIGPGRKGQERAAGVAEEIIRRRLPVTFRIDCRADDVDYGLFALLKRAGMSEVFIGFEAGMQRLLNTFGKGLTVQDNCRALAIIRLLGIKFTMGWIANDPYITLEEAKENYLSFRSLFGEPVELWPIMNKLGVFAGTEIEAQLRRESNLFERGPYVLDYEFRDSRISRLYSYLDMALSLGVNDLHREVREIGPRRSALADLVDWVIMRGLQFAAEPASPAQDRAVVNELQERYRDFVRCI